MNVETIDFLAPNASQLFSKSLKKTGFCVLKNHPISVDLINSIYDEWRTFLESEDTDQYLFDKIKQDGYFPKNISEVAKGCTVKDIKHYYHLYFPWGRYPKETSNLAKQYFDVAFALGKTLLEWIELHMKKSVAQQLHQPLTDCLSYDRTLLRIMQYPPLTGKEEKGSIRAASHEDINLITLLPVASEPGLEVYSIESKSWSPVICDEGNIVINIGDMLQEMTQKDYISTSHRVTNPTGNAAKKDRISMPTFMHAKADVYLSKRYPTADNYLQERLAELGVK
ncbi:MAG: isopenicillin N synthase-like dioxygenase [Francisellaceae bacterium]|jgi:isopenicillin N synthase-like dioxygenase